MSSSSANSSTPEKQSKDSSGKAVLAGAIIGTVLALVIAFLIIFYILRKKKQEQTLRYTYVYMIKTILFSSIEKFHIIVV